MFAVEVITPPAGVPILPEELRNRLRLNEQGEDDELAEFLGAAVEQFELDSNRPVLSTVYRQDLSRWPAGVVILGRGGVTDVAAVRRYLADGTAEDLDQADWYADIATPPARVYLSTVPPVESSPVGCVEFTAGWTSAEVVPKVVRTALMLLAAHYYENREAYTSGTLTQVPAGWWPIVNRYKLGVVGDWGQ